MAIVLGTLGLYSASLQTILHAWNDTNSHTYTHGYLIAAIGLGLLFWRRDDLRAQPISTGPWAIALLLPCAFIWLIGLRAPIQIAHELMVPMLLWTAVYGLLGWPIARLCLFPIGYLYFGIPLWDHGNDVLQTLSVLAVRALVRATSIPAYFEGEFVEIPAGIFHIEDGCSGLHFLIVALALACLQGEIDKCSLRARSKLIALAVACALISNWLRIYIIILAGHLTNMQHYLVRVDHYYFGWAVFALAMTCFFTIGVRWIPTTAQCSKRVEAARVITGSRHFGYRIAVVVLLLCAPAWYLISTQFPRPEASVTLPHAEGWSGPFPLPTGSTVYGRADLQRRASYVHGDRNVDLYMAAFRDQVSGKKISGYLVEHESAPQDVARVTRSGHSYAERQSTASGTPALSWTRYDVGDKAFSSPVAAQLWYGLASLFTMPPVRVTTIQTSCVSSCDIARAELKQFAETALEH